MAWLPKKTVVVPVDFSDRSMAAVHEALQMVDDPKALYSSFRTRRVKAQYRASVAAPGPKRTAEGYVLAALLREQIEQSASTTDAPEASGSR